ncbi:MAG: hypothetical protein ABW032_01665, partial [Burkholderiaceae bacterium]
MGLLSIFQRNRRAVAQPAKSCRARGKASARRSPAGFSNSLPPVEAADAVREARARARRRLMGATVLLLIGVIGFPLLFETQPRPIPVDLPIDIPSRNAAGEGASAGSARSKSAANAAIASPASSPAPESVSYDTRQAVVPAPTPASPVPATAVAPSSTAQGDKPSAFAS